MLLELIIFDYKMTISFSTSELLLDATFVCQIVCHILFWNGIVKVFKTEKKVSFIPFEIRNDWRKRFNTKTHTHTRKAMGIVGGALCLSLCFSAYNFFLLLFIALFRVLTLERFLQSFRISEGWTIFTRLKAHFNIKFTY